MVGRLTKVKQSSAEIDARYAALSQSWRAGTGQSTARWLHTAITISLTGPGLQSHERAGRAELVIPETIASSPLDRVLSAVSVETPVLLPETLHVKQFENLLETFVRLTVMHPVTKQHGHNCTVGTQ